ncbi:MAG: hypothetical protein P8J33_08565, partial [Pirellulaceae bacterium]|nr:hypothetical protein [Pirellulaceae bacterium]
MIRMISVFVICFFCVLPIPNGIAQQATSIIWKGELDGNGQRLRLELNLLQNGDTWTGQIRSLDQNNHTMELSDLKYNDEELSFAIPQVGAQF